MVINTTLGFATGFAPLDRAVPGMVSLDADCGGVACTVLVAAFCVNAVHAAMRTIATANERAGECAESRVEKRLNMRLLRRRLLLRAPRLLVCFRGQPLGGQSLGQRLVHDAHLRRQLHRATQLRNGLVKLALVEQGFAQGAMSTRKLGINPNRLP